MILIDAVLINLAYIFALYYGFSFHISKNYIYNYEAAIIPIILIYLVSFIIAGMYKSLWVYAGTDEFLIAVAVCSAACSIGIIFNRLIGVEILFSVQVLAGIFTIMFVCGFRICFRIYRRIIIIAGKAENKNSKRIMVIGAGFAGAMIIKEMKLNKRMNYNPVAVIDDSVYKQGKLISGVKVLGDRSKIQKIVKEKNIDIILIAIPSLDKENKRQILDICKKTNCKIKIVPGVYEIISEKYLLRQIRNVDVEDLLGRETARLDMEGISDYIENRVIMVTGAGGSIGSELCRQIVKFNPKQLILIDIYENNVYEIQNELKYNYPYINLAVKIASIRDKRRLENIFKEYKPEVVFHAAAHKHVPLMEGNPSEAVKNNIFGTLNLSEYADNFGVKRFVLISTDKAVNPTNIMGATKRTCEMIVQAMDKISKTEFVAVRFGNVLGSNGSVIPLFKKQIAHGGPVTLTHKDITRYFMTIPEAVQLVLQAAAYAKGGEIFVLDMGKPVKIYDLACDTIRLSGFEPGKDIKIEVTGLRPGEKLYEELLMKEEGLSKTRNEKIFAGRPTSCNFDELKKKLDELQNVIDMNDNEEIFRKMEEIVPAYKRQKISQ